MNKLIEELKNEYLYHSKEILKKLDDEGYELGTTISLIEEIIKEIN